MKPRLNTYKDPSERSFFLVKLKRLDRAMAIPKLHVGTSQGDLPTVVTAIPEFLLQEWNLFWYVGSTPEISRPILELPKIHKSQIQLDENEDLSHFLGRFFTLEPVGWTWLNIDYCKEAVNL